MRIPRVFLVEDNDFDLDLMKDVVTSNDLQAVPAEGDSWIDDLEAAPAARDVVVVDLDLPDQRGRQVLDRLRARPAKERPRIVALSLDEPAAGGAGIEEILRRPLDVGGFARAVVRQSRAANLD